MPQPHDLPIPTWSARFRARLGDRAIATAVVLAIEALLLLALFSLGQGIAGRKDSITVVDLKANPPGEEAPPEPEVKPEPDQSTAATLPPPPSEPRPTPIAPLSVPSPLPVIPVPRAPPAPTPPPAPRPTRSIAPAEVYGPTLSPGARLNNDSERVGTAPNGEPLYAARWYREPTDQELRGYLSTASAPAWGLVACRTAPDFRVEDCVGLAESPGSNMLRAILAATWQFKVRPPQLGGRPQIGEWVRIRIDYTVQRG